MKQTGKGRIYRSILGVTIVPILLFGLIVLLFCSARFTSAVYEEVENELHDVADGLLLTYDLLYPGEYSLRGDDKIVAFFKGEEEITGKFTIPDEMKEKTGMEITIFYQDTRMVTTICDEEGERLIGSGANAVICQDVLTRKEATFYSHVNINGKYYFAYYAPLLNRNGACMGMLAVARPAEQVRKMISSTIMPMIFITIGMMIVAGLVGLSYSRKLSKAIRSLQADLDFVSKGNLTKEPDYFVLERNDEIGEMGRSVIVMQKALRVLIEQDALTELYNRRCANKKLRQTIRKAKESGIKYAVGIGDIDFFKKVNDTYGHEMGDRVLREVSKLLRNSMVGKGYVARWGGEEFLVVFENMEATQATAYLWNVLKQLENMVVREEEKGYEVKVSMTFGLTQGEQGSNLDALLVLADARLYEGKTGGRNQVVGVSDKDDIQEDVREEVIINSETMVEKESVLESNVRTEDFRPDTETEQDESVMNETETMEKEERSDEE